MNALIVAIPQSMNHFHGDHWYHIGEHFFGRRNEVSTICHLSASCTNLILMTPCPFLHKMMTSFTLFLAFLSFQCPGLRQIELVKPTGSMPVAQTNSTISFTGYSTRFFSFINNSQAPVYLKTGTVKVKDAMSYSGLFALSMDTTPVPTTVWFNHTEEAITVRKRLSTLCNGSLESKVVKIEEKKLRLLIYERDQNRRLTNLNSIANTITFDDILHFQWDTTIIKHDDTRLPCDLYQSFQQADVLLTTHGFQLTGHIFEIIFHNYYIITFILVYFHSSGDFLAARGISY